MDSGIAAWDASNACIVLARGNIGAPALYDDPRPPPPPRGAGSPAHRLQQPYKPTGLDIALFLVDHHVGIIQRTTGTRTCNLRKAQQYILSQSDTSWVCRALGRSAQTHLKSSSRPDQIKSECRVQPNQKNQIKIKIVTVHFAPNIYILAERPHLRGRSIEIGAPSSVCGADDRN